MFNVGFPTLCSKSQLKNMRVNNIRIIRFFLSLVWTELVSSSLVVRISKIRGHDYSSCWISNATTPCKSVDYALGALQESRNSNETIFTFSIEDQIYSLENRVQISQTSKEKIIFLKSGNPSARNIIRCEDKVAGIDIRTKDSAHHKTRNIHFQNLEFQNCGPHTAAVVLIWNSIDISFTNCVFGHNTQAGMNAYDSGVIIENCTFVNNTSNGRNSNEEYKEGVDSAGGGAGFLYHNAVNLSLIIRNSIFESNAAVTNTSLHFIAPSSNVSHFTTGGGGIIVVFRRTATDCRVVIDNSVFLNNTATYGGGIYFADSNMAVRNTYTVTNSNFSGNYAGQTGGGLIFSQWDNASSTTTVFKNCIISENTSKRGAGMNVFLMNYDSKPNDSVLR